MSIALSKLLNRRFLLPALLVCVGVGLVARVSVRAADSREARREAEEKAEKARQAQPTRANDVRHPVVPTPTPQTVLDDDNAENDPDLPGFLRGTIDLQSYLAARQDAIQELRGLPLPVSKAHPNPRAEAIRTMEQQMALQFDRASQSGGLPPAGWTEIGPSPIPNGQTTTRTDPVSGRTTAIAIKPSDPNVVYVGTAQGGVYRTLDGGATWTSLFDNAQSLAVGSIAIAPSDNSIVYVGTGEPNGSGDSFFGVGLYRIENAETTADLVGPINPQITLGGPITTNCFTGRAISKVLVNPTNAAEIWVSTASGITGIGATALTGFVPPLGLRGIYHSTNATAAPAAVVFDKETVTTAAGLDVPSTGNRNVMDIVFDPADTPNTMYSTVQGATAAAGDGGIYKSTNAGATWTQVLNVSSTAGIRLSLAVNRVASQTTLYSSTGETVTGCAAGDGGVVRRSTDNGATWPILTGGKGFCGGQCFYDQPIAVDPTNANNVFIGGAGNSTCSVTYSHSTNGGTSFTRDDVGLHADAHAIAVAPSNPLVVYEGNDGGIWKSTDGGFSWTSLNVAGYNATQFSGLSQHPIDREFMLGGTQDNGTQLRKADGTWFRADFGDGGYARIDQNATDTSNVTMYHTYFNQTTAMGFARVDSVANAHDNGWPFFGCGFVAGTNGLNCGTATAIQFYAPVELGPGSPNTVYFGSDGLFRSADKGVTMPAVSQVPLQAGVSVTTIGIAPQNDNVRLVGMRFGKVFATHNGSSTLVDVTGTWRTGNIQPRPFVSRVKIDPNDVNTAYVTFAEYCTTATPATAGDCAQVWKTTNLVTALAASTLPTWTAANTGLPDIPVSSFAIDPRNSLNLFAGTDIGVYNSTDGGASWAPYGTGLPRVAVFELALQGSTGLLRAATHGRGIWEISAGKPTPAFSNLTSDIIAQGDSPTLLGGKIAAGSLIPPGSVSITLNGVTQSAAIQPDGTFSSSFDTSALTTGGSPYTIAYQFDATADYNAASGSGTLTVVAQQFAVSIAFGAPSVTYPAPGVVTLTLTSGGGTPTGTVFLSVDGGAALSQAVDGSGHAVFTLNGITAGDHTLAATYPEQGVFLTSSNTGSIHVDKGTPVFSNLSSPKIGVGQTPSVLGGTILSGSAAPSGSVSITLNGTTLTGAIAASGAFSASFATNALALGPFPIDYSYPGDANFNPASGSGTLTVVTPATASFSNPASIAINDQTFATPYPSTIAVAGMPGQVVKATVTITNLSHTFVGDVGLLLVSPEGRSSVLLYSPNLSGGPVNRTYVFDDAGGAFPSSGASGTYRPTQAGTVPSFPGVAPAGPYGTRLFSMNGGAPNGTWKLYVEDHGPGDTGTITGGWSLALSVDQPLASSTSLAAAPNPVDAGVSVTYTATVSSAFTAAPTGSVDFKEGATTVGTGTVTAGAATFTTSYASAGAHVVTATYNGDSNYAASTSAPVTENVFNTTSTVLTGAPNPANVDATVTYTATVTSPQGGTPSGSVTFKEGATTVGTGTLASGVATFSTSYGTLGSHTLTAVYGGDSSYDPSTSAGFTENVLNGSTTSLVSSVNPVGLGANVTYTATVASPQGGTPTGSVDFKDGAAVVQTVALVSGQAAFTTSYGTVGSHSISAVYSGDATYNPSTSATVVENVAAVGLSAGDTSITEGNSGRKPIVMTVSLNAPSASTVTVKYHTAGQTARGGKDYVDVSGTLTFAPGETVKTVTTAIMGNRVREGDKVFKLVLTSATNAVILRAQGTETILNDD